MFLNLIHTRLDVFQSSKSLVLECYKLTEQFPSTEKFGMVRQIRRAALSVHLNIAEGCSRKSSQERKRFFEIARGSVIEIDTAVDVAVSLHHCSIQAVQVPGAELIKTFKLLCGLIGSSDVATHN
jgi:four helix bundle protein